MNEESGLLTRRPRAIDVQNRESFGAEFAALLAERTGRFTMRDSTSVRAETAEALARGILYCIDLHLRTAPDGPESAAPLKTLYEAGVADAKRLARRGKLMLRQAEANRPPIANIGLNDTLSALPLFFRRYDADFFAHEAPCDIDYPLSVPVSESLAGAEYINEYLRRLIIENTFLRRFHPALLECVYQSQYGDYDGLLVNLYAPVAEAAVGRLLAGKTAKNLRTDSADRGLIWRRFSGLPDATANAALKSAAASVCEELGVAGKLERDYLEMVALALLPRIRSARGPDELGGAFAPSAKIPDGPEPETVFFDGPRMTDAELRRLIAELQGCRYVSDQAAEIRRSVRSMRDLVEILDVVMSDGLCEALAADMDEREKAELGRIHEARNGGPNEKNGETKTHGELAIRADDDSV